MTKHEEVNMIQALNQALHLYFHRCPEAVLLGEDIGKFGGVFRVTEGLQQKYGSQRVIDTPLAECGITGSAVGMALGGLRPIVEIQFADFVFPGINQIINEMAKYRYRSGGHYHLPIVVRMPYGGGIGGGHYHSQSPEAIFTHIPGLRVVIPSGPYEAKGLLLSALCSEDPVIFMEPKQVYRSKKAVVPNGYYTLPLDQAQVIHAGDDVTLIAYGAMTHVASEAAQLALQEGIQVEVIDLLNLVPYDINTIRRSVCKTGRAIVIHEAPQTSGFGAELVAMIQSHCFDSLAAPIERLTGFDTPFPYALENHYMVNSKRILSSIHRVINY